MFTKAFWKAAAERAVKTAAQSAILVFGAEQVNAIAVDWLDVGGFAAGGFVLSLLTSLASSQFGPGDGPAAAGPEVVLDAEQQRILGKA